MQRIPNEEVVARLRTENPWWADHASSLADERSWRRRAYFEPFVRLVNADSPRRAVVLMGPRRVGKTVLIRQAIAQLLDENVPPAHICYISVDHPIYTGMSVDRLLDLFRGATNWDGRSRAYLFLDEIQYLRDWERHLKALVDEQHKLRVIASGSAAAALRLKSQESGAGRFTEFILPPLTFYEYLGLTDQRALLEGREEGYGLRYAQTRPDIDQLNDAFMQYLNFGGYPEVLFSDVIRADMPRYIKSDIVDKVLLRDLPGLYGITDVQELNALFTSLAYNTGQEITLEELSQNSGVAKNTIKRYIEYLAAAFLIRVVHRVDQAGKRFQRANYFKVYLTNPTMRTALFAPVGADDPAAGRLVETGIFAQLFHHDLPLHYARWKDGEVDLVIPSARRAGAARAFVDIVEIKWSDRHYDRPQDLGSLLDFCERHRGIPVLVTTRRVAGNRRVGNLTLRFEPAAELCFRLGRRIESPTGGRQSIILDEEAFDDV